MPVEIMAIWPLDPPGSADDELETMMWPGSEEMADPPLLQAPTLLVALAPRSWPVPSHNRFPTAGGSVFLPALATYPPSCPPAVASLLAPTAFPDSPSAFAPLSPLFSTSSSSPPSPGSPVPACVASPSSPSCWFRSLSLGVLDLASPPLPAPAGGSVLPSRPCSPPSPPPVPVEFLCDPDVLDFALSVDLAWSLPPVPGLRPRVNPRTVPVVTVHPGLEERAQAWRRLFTDPRRRPSVARDGDLPLAVAPPLAPVALPRPQAYVLSPADRRRRHRTMLRARRRRRAAALALAASLDGPSAPSPVAPLPCLVITTLRAATQPSPPSLDSWLYPQLRHLVHTYDALAPTMVRKRPRSPSAPPSPPRAPPESADGTRPIRAPQRVLRWDPLHAPVCAFDLPGFGPQPDPALMRAQRFLHPPLFNYAEPFGPSPDPSLTIFPTRCAAAVELLQCISDLTGAAATAIRATAQARGDPALADPRTVEELASLWTVLSTAVAAVPVCLLPSDMAGLAAAPRR